MHSFPEVSCFLGRSSSTRIITTLKIFLGLNFVAGCKPFGPRSCFSNGNLVFTDLQRARSQKRDDLRQVVKTMRGRDELTLAKINRSAADARLYAKQHLTITLRAAQASLPYASEATIVAPWFVVFQCASTFISTTILATVFVPFIFPPGSCFPSSCSRSSPLGILYGLLGGAALRRVEMWRRACSGERVDSLERARGGDNDELLEKGMLLGMAPTSFAAWLLLQDVSFGERSVGAANEHCTEPQKAFLQLVGSFSSCTLVQGLLQQILALQFTSTADLNAISGTPEDSFMASWWPFVASARTVAPAATVLVTAALEFSAYLIVCQSLLPMANDEAQACQEAVALARRRCAQLFLFDAPREVASLRAEAFEELAKEWEERQRECNQRRIITNLFRVLIAATVYEASGGSILAPVLTNVVVTDSVLGVLRGKPWSK